MKRSALQSRLPGSQLQTSTVCPLVLCAGSSRALRKTKKKSEISGFVIPFVSQVVPFYERWLCFGQPERGGLRSLSDTISNNITRNLIEIFLREYRNVLSGCSENTG